jgi:hypothetical protein
MFAYDTDTLNHHTKERPGTMFRDLSGVPMNEMGKALAVAKQRANGKVQPEQEAVVFYLLNHAVAEIAQKVDTDEPLGDYLPIVENYHRALNRLGFRLFSYLFCITTREARHLNEIQFSKLSAAHPPVLVNFLSNRIKSKAQEALFDCDLPGVTVGQYLDFIADIYYVCTWGGSFGGPKWGVITDCLRSVVKGESSIEMMLDVGYTLAHNTSSIFNKGMYYNDYSGDDMIVILDCQRAGQIPNYVKSGEYPHVNKEAHGLLKQIEDAGLMTVQPWVNWGLVELLGSMKKYPSFKVATEHKFGGNADYQVEVASTADKAHAKQVANLAALAAKEAAENEGTIEIMPGVKLKKAKAVRAA